MIIKRYIVDNMNEAMVKIRYELGSDAVIVSQRKIGQSGLLGIFKPKRLEVTAAADDKLKKMKEAIEARDQVQKELVELKAMVQNITVVQKEPPQTVKKEPRNKVKQRLLDIDIPTDIVEDLYAKVRENNKNKRLNSKDYEKEIRSIIEDMIKIDSDIKGKVQVLVGPTGVGKTTTIAKLASMYTLYKNKKVGLITIDTYRIGAVEQLKSYAEILGVPFGVVLSVADIPEVLSKMENCDVIFIDTTGRNSKNLVHVAETKKFVEEFNPDKIHLVLSMTTKQKDLKKIIENYRITNYNSIILTKLDETEAYGSALASLYYSNVPVSYLTNGQDVPADIEEAQSEKLLKLIMGAE